jgi:hypothetical protein
MVFHVSGLERHDQKNLETSLPVPGICAVQAERLLINESKK